MLKFIRNVCLSFAIVVACVPSLSFSSTAFEVEGRILNEIGNGNLLELVVPSPKKSLTISVYFDSSFSKEDLSECRDGVFEIYENYEPAGTYTLIDIIDCL